MTALLTELEKPAGRHLDAIHRWVDPGYFAAIGIPLLRGSAFDDNQRPGHATEVIISESFSMQIFPGEDRVGKYLRTSGDRDYEIVGIVGDTRFSFGDLPLATRSSFAQTRT
jgi:hypothetical protein